MNPELIIASNEIKHNLDVETFVPRQIRERSSVAPLPKTAAGRTNGKIWDEEVRQLEQAQDDKHESYKERFDRQLSFALIGEPKKEPVNELGQKMLKGWNTK